MMGGLLDPIKSAMPRSRSLQAGAALTAFSLLLALLAFNNAGAVAPSNEHFQRVWDRNDRPVAEGLAVHTWIWGPEGISNELTEPYADSPGGTRQVQYFDKSRMEINYPDADPNDIWYVTNGLLVNELMSGQMQIGDNDFVDRFPADIPVAGDVTDEAGITYAMLAEFVEVPPVEFGTVYTQRLHPDGTLTNEPELAAYNVSADFLDEVTNHRIAAPFWEFMNAQATIYVDGQFVEGPVFPNPFYGTGRPRTEFYWVTSEVGGVVQDVGIQCFERRCLTYTPGNEEGWRVEAGNVGLHYYIWRYETPDPSATPTATAPATATPTATASPTASPTPTTPAAVDVTINAFVNCDGEGAPEGAARPVGETGVCDGFVGGEIVTLNNGVSDTVNEVQELGLNNATGGSISLTFHHPILDEDIVITGIVYNASADQIRARMLGAFDNHGVVGDTPAVEPQSSDPDALLNEADMLIIFENGDLAGMDVPEMVADNRALIGATVVGTISTVIEGSSGQDETQMLTASGAAGGTFRLSFNHPVAGSITTSPIAFNASAGMIAAELANAFGGEGVGEDAPTVSGGPANIGNVTFVFENGDLAGVDVPPLVVDNAGLGSQVAMSEVEVFDDGETVATWQIGEDGTAGGSLQPGQYNFCFTYTEDSGQTDTVCTGTVEVSATNDAFTLTAMLEYES